MNDAPDERARNLTAARWQQVRDRTNVGHGSFVYAVRTTKIYCRPTCPSRRPLQRNVEFFDARELAAAGGYRPCRRCRPDLDVPDETWITRVCQALEQASKSPTLAELSVLVNLSPSYIQRKFTRVVGVSPRQYAAARRSSRWRTELNHGAPVTQSIYDAGFSSSSAAYGESRSTLGMTPKRFRDGGRGVQVSYAVLASQLGDVLVAATSAGLVAVRIGEGDALVDQLHIEFPNATLIRDDDVIAPQARRVLDRIVHHHETDDLPLDIAATAFQARVWSALRAIPVGATRSYGEIAAAIGAPKSARAVASACAQNPVAVVIPCHRVVHADGTLSGYRWGVAVKATLIAEERRVSGVDSMG